MADQERLMHFVPSEELRPTIDRIFEAEKKMLVGLVPGADIQHNGSTAIPGALTKGDLDIQVRVTAELVNQAVTAISPYYHVNHPELWTTEFALFERYDDPVVPIGVVVTAIGSEYDEYHKMRDLFINNHELLLAYNALKQIYEGRPESEYKNAKHTFFGPNGHNRYLSGPNAGIHETP